MSCGVACPLIEVLEKVNTFHVQGAEIVPFRYYKQATHSLEPNVYRDGGWGSQEYEWRKEDWELVKSRAKRELCVLCDCQN